jgi:hypothetical protein
MMVDFPSGIFSAFGSKTGPIDINFVSIDISAPLGQV